MLLHIFLNLPLSEEVDSLDNGPKGETRRQREIKQGNRFGENII